MQNGQLSVNHAPWVLAGAQPTLEPQASAFNVIFALAVTLEEAMTNLLQSKLPNAQSQTELPYIQISNNAAH